jgi:RNA polymerase sigma-70 factor (ECF subfamily)
MTGHEWRHRWQRSRPTAARNIVIYEWRTTSRSAEADIDRIPDQPIVDASDPPVSRHLVAAALGRLTREHRDVLGELYLRGSSVAQAAHALGIAPGTVKSRTYYALRALRLAIEELRGIADEAGPG